ncbi:MAG TPA: hypothetical protein VMG12_43240 [Polyangiaceae bacterium]|nr:hypothetical protein [Polyangiaceae bacterium]
MQHGRAREVIRYGWGFLGSLAAAVAGSGCGGDSRAIEAQPPPTPEPADPAPDAPGIEGETPTSTHMPAEATPGPPVEPPAPDAVSACTTEVNCLVGSTAPCTLHCVRRPDGCEVISEFVPLQPVDEGYSLRFGPIDPGGKWMFYASEWSGGRYDVTPYRFSEADGVYSLSDVLRLPPSAQEYESLYVEKVAAGGDAILVQRIETDLPVEAYLWTRDAGLTALDFEPMDLSADGRVVSGVSGGRALIWDRVRGTRFLDGGALDAAPAPPTEGVPAFSVLGIGVSDTGERALVRGFDGSGFIWTEAQGLVPFESLPGFPAGVEVTLADANGPVLWAHTGDVFGPEPQRLFRWTEGDGARALGTLPDLPPDTSYTVSMALAGGQILIGDARASDGVGLVPFRWSSELGMQSIGNVANMTPYYANSDASTIIGYVANDGVLERSVRWTASEGSSELPGDVRGGIALGGDLLLARVWDGAKAETRVLRYGRALEPANTLPIDLLEAGLLPEGYEMGFIESISDNARLLGGTATGADGVTRGWMVRVLDSCSP